MAIGPLRLADKSAWEQARYDRRARDRLHELRQAKQLAVCVISISELLYSARNAEELARLRLDLSSLPYLHLTEAAERQVEELMGALATRGQHRILIPDLMLPTALGGVMPLFVSYSSKDSTSVKPLIRDLETTRHAVWVDQELTGGESWWREILQHADTATPAARVVTVPGSMTSALPCEECRLTREEAEVGGTRGFLQGRLLCVDGCRDRSPGRCRDPRRTAPRRQIAGR